MICFMPIIILYFTEFVNIFTKIFSLSCDKTQNKKTAAFQQQSFDVLIAENKRMCKPEPFADPVGRDKIP